VHEYNVYLLNKRALDTREYFYCFNNKQPQIETHGYLAAVHVCPLPSDTYWLSFVAITYGIRFNVDYGQRSSERLLRNEELNTTRTRRFICGQVRKDDCYVKKKKKNCE